MAVLRVLGQSTEKIVHRRTHTCHAKHWPTPTSVITVAKKRGLQSTMLATASYTSKNGHISTMSHQFCEAFSAKRVQEQIKWATASRINAIFGISREWRTSLAGVLHSFCMPVRELRHSRDILKIVLIRLAVAHFIWSWTCLAENASQNRWLIVEICPFLLV